MIMLLTLLMIVIVRVLDASLDCVQVPPPSTTAASLARRKLQIPTSKLQDPDSRETDQSLPAPEFRPLSPVLCPLSSAPPGFVGLRLTNLRDYRVR